MDGYSFLSLGKTGAIGSDGAREKAEEAVDALEEAMSALEEAVENIETACE